MKQGVRNRTMEALFDDKLPFRQKVVQLKIGYKRKPKHRGRELDQQ